MAEKIALVFFNLGGPSCQEDIRPFLTNFFNDPNIIAAPTPIRKLIAWWIAYKRSRGEALESYRELGYKSPLLETTKAQAKAVQVQLSEKYPNATFKSFVAMSYWHPFAAEALQGIQEFGADRVIGIPLYPQYSTTTTKTAFNYFVKAAEDLGIICPNLSLICCWPENSGFIEASARLVQEKLQEARTAAQEKRPVRLLFSAHGLPKKIIDGGDPYQAQCEKTAEKIVETLGETDLDWGMCYQSRVGPLEWIGPSTEDALTTAATDKVDVVIYPLAFVSDHVETLVEIEIEYREFAENLGIEGFFRVPTVMTEPEFIKGLADIISERLDQNILGLCSDTCTKPCDQKFKKCAFATKDSFGFDKITRG